MSVAVNTTNNDGWDNTATHLSALSWHRCFSWNNNFWQFFQHDCFDSIFAIANLSATGQVALYENNNTSGASPQVVLSSSDTSWICIARVVTTGGPGVGGVTYYWRKEGQSSWNTVTMLTGASGFVNPIGSTELIGHSGAQPPYNQRVSSYKGWNSVLTGAQLLTESTQSLAVIRTNLVIETSMAVGSTMGADTSGNGNNWTITQTAGDYTFNADEPNMAISGGSSYTPSANAHSRDDSREESPARSKWLPVSGQAVASQPTYSRRVAREEYQEERYSRKLWQPLAVISGYPFARRRVSEEFADELVMRRATIVQPQAPDQPALGVWLVAEEPEAEPLPPRRIVVPVSGPATANVSPFEREAKLGEETQEERLSRRPLPLPVSGPAIASQPIPQRVMRIDRDEIEERVARRALFVPQAVVAVTQQPFTRRATPTEVDTEERTTRRLSLSVSGPVVASPSVPRQRGALPEEGGEEPFLRRPGVLPSGPAIASPYVGRRQLPPSELDTEESDRRSPVVVQAASAAPAQPMRVRAMVAELDGEERAPRRPLVLPSGPAVASPYVARPQRLPAEADPEESDRRAPVVLASSPAPTAYPFGRRQATQESVDEQPTTRRAVVQGALDPVPFSRRQMGEPSTTEERIGRRALFVQQGPAQTDSAPLNRPRAAEPALPEERLGRLSPAALFAAPPRIDNPPARRNARASEDHEERPRIQRNWVVVSGVPMPALVPHFSARVPPRLWRAKVHR